VSAEHLTYLASPYSHPDATVRMARYDAVIQAQSAMFRKGIHVYSPIAQCAEAAERHGLPTDFAFWMRFNRRMITSCDSMTVLCIDGWQSSRGIREEVAIAQDRGMPVRWVDVDGDEVDWMEVVR